MRVPTKFNGLAALLAATLLAGTAFATGDDTSDEAVATTEAAATEEAAVTEEAAAVTEEAAATAEESAAATTEEAAAAVEEPIAAPAPVDLGELPSIGKPNQDGYGFQEAVTEVARDIHWLDNFVLIIITVICIFVTVLLLICAFWYNARRNKTAATFTHNSMLEIGWTVIPIVVLIAIAGPSLALLFKQMEIPEADVTIKATGNQWYWTHEYVDHEFGFDSYMIGAEGHRLTDEVKAELVAAGYNEDEWLLATDTAVVLPVNKTIVVQVTGADVIHAWTIPAFGVKQDAVPGRIAELWFKVEKEGVYFGQCSELCGKDHTYMPITVKIVSEEKYEEWLAGAKAEYAGVPQPVTVASN